MQSPLSKRHVGGPGSEPASDNLPVVNSGGGMGNTTRGAKTTKVPVTHFDGHQGSPQVPMSGKLEVHKELKNRSGRAGYETDLPDPQDRHSFPNGSE